MTFAEAVKDLRLKAGLTQMQLAAAVGRTQGAITMIETGRQENVGFDLCARLCRALGVSLDYFVPYLAPGVAVLPPPTVPPARPEPPARQKAELDWLPVRGTVAAGLGDTPTVFSPPKRHPVARYYASDCYALQVTGRSCTRWGICDGDLVYVRESREAMEGRFVVAMSGSEFTLKAYHRGRLWQFRPEDEEPVEVRLPDDDHIRIVGVVIGGEFEDRSYRPDVKAAGRRKG